MATQIIDTSLHLAAFPLGYTGPGNLIGNPVQSGGEACDVYGFFTSSTGNAVQINVGFQPLQVDIVDVTGALTWHWQWGMPASNSVKVTLGTIAGVIDTTSAITVTTDIAGNGQVTLSTGLCGNAKNICFHIQG
jgi:hypothetical protein